MPNDFLLATWDGGGHAGPMLSVGSALLRRGHRVRVLADPVLRPEVEASGATFVPWREAPHNATRGRSAKLFFENDAGGDSPREASKRLRDALIAGPASRFAADVRGELARRPADVVVADHLLPGALIGGEAEGTRTVALATSLLFIPQWGVPAMGFGLEPPTTAPGRLRHAVIARLFVRFWRGALPAYNAAREEHGLAPITDPLDLVAGWDRLLVASSRAIEYPTFAPPPHVELVGARLDDPAWVAPWTPPPGEDPLVLISLSSTDMRQRDGLTRAAAALGPLPVRGLVTTGPAVDPAAVAAPPNVTVTRSAPHGEVLRHAAAAVTHGGHGTVAKTLAAGVPQVVLPLGRDQLDIGQRVVAAGAGLRLKPASSPERIAAAVRRVLTEPAFRSGARRAAAIMAREGEHDRAVEALEALLSREPVAIAA